jgi:hypothetical protein
MYLLGMYVPVLCTRYLPVIQYLGTYYGMYHPMYCVLRWRYIRYSPQDLIRIFKAELQSSDTSNKSLHGRYQSTLLTNIARPLAVILDFGSQ